ncbi:MAG: exonuclease domain-containing protein [Candidatus Taylorbacteria bacterium]|nr:exonuclease domain-containing protein [Candidatus Taylorbacteria bacterium]
MLNLPKTIIAFDTELTTWEGAMARNWSGPNEYKEIVQIGAVRVETETKELRELDSFVCYIKPIKNPLLSQYFIDLTKITQNKVEQEGKTLQEGVGNFYEWSHGDTLYSWGLDSDEVLDNCRILGLNFPFANERFKDVRDIFVSNGIKTEGYMSSTIVEAVGGKVSRQGHDGLNDARSIVDALRLLVNRDLNVY